ncbi:ABC-type multidrug transport system, permease component [Saccharomonospora marina XMU15]|uniref:Transport permease protein n=1 Tax=Saccharomonospora marina XMU15 TaxID=882083 RepID=H5WXJ6_9PSEU|nr:ABC transporter permease [Saccharomonospora marina]EHR50599.1 ABC-type multidrug transport system, permease component [Saccharomonospora marina XMU15]
MTGYRALTATLLRSLVREPVGLFFSFIFAPFLVLVLGLIFDSGPDPAFGGRSFIEATLPAFPSLVLAITGVLLAPVGLLTLRESGALRRLRLTPLRPSTFVAADLTVNFVVGMTSMISALAVGWAVFGVTPSGNLVAVLAAAALGLVAFLALGYTLAGLYPSAGAATGIGNALMLVLMLSSGAFVPLATMPDGVQTVMNFSPVRHFANLIQGLWEGQPWSGLLLPTGILLSMVIVFGALGSLLFRWERA